MSHPGVMELLTLPHEIVQNVLSWVEPTDLSSVSRTCHALADFVRSNKALWKAVFLNSYDGPPSQAAPNDIEWKGELQAVVAAQKLLASDDTQAKRDAFRSTGLTLIKILKSARSPVHSSVNIKILRSMFLDEMNQNVFFCSSSLFAEAGSEHHLPRDDDQDKQLSAQLHCLYGAPRWGWDTGDETATHPYARARVYDIRRFTEGTMWGPFKDDGSQSVDWEKMEAIITVLGYNLKLFHDRTNGMFDFHWNEGLAWFGASPYSFPKPSKGLNPPMEDPYGVTGTWLRIVCFLDYFEFFSFNFRTHRPASEEDQEPLDTEEAIRLIKMTFVIDRIEPPQPGDGQALPVVHFKGKSRAMQLGSMDPNANSDLIGCVRQTPEGEIRWTTWSVYVGQARWRSEGIQVGGIQSSRGVIGNWFDKDFDPHGPAGPTAFWKTTYEIEDECNTRARLVTTTPPP